MVKLGCFTFKVSWLSWNGVVTASSPRVTTQKPFDEKPRSFENTMFDNGLYAVVRAGWLVTASIG